MKTRLQFKPTSMPKIFPSRIVGATRVSRPRLPSHLRDLDGRAPAHPTKSSIWWGPRAAPKPSSRGPALPRHASPMHSSSRHLFLGSGRGLDWDSVPMRLFQKAKRLGTWDPQAIDFSSDGADWAAFDSVERDFLLRTVALFQAGEEGVTTDLLPLIMVIAREGRIEE